MTEKSTWAQIQKILPLNRKSLSLIVIFSLLILFGAFRACNAPPKEDHMFRIAHDPSWFPLDVEGKGRELIGFSNDLILTIAKRNGVEVELVTATAQTLLVDLHYDKYDAILSGLQPNPINQRIYNFSDVYYPLGPVLIVPINSRVNSIEQMHNQTVAIPRGESNPFALSKYKINFTPFDSVTAAFQDMNLNLIDGILMDMLPASSYLNSFYASQAKIVTPPLDNFGIRIIARKTNHSSKVLKIFNEGLQELKEDQIYQQLLKKWGLPNPFAVNSDNQKEP